VGNLWVVVPAYRESAVIAQTLRGLARFLPRVVVVDDGSADETASLARDAGAVIVQHAVNLGAGAATQTGIEYALSQGADYVCTFDADGQHDSSTIDVMLEALTSGKAEVALGSRFLGATEGMTAARRLVLRVAIAFTRWQTGLPLSDTHNGLRAFTRRAAELIDLRHAGMAHGSEILAQIARQRLSYVEVPTTVRYSAYSMRKGQSLSNSVKIVFELFYAAWSR
jgi:glycosyltransferase involved in cell wall biosynthesis